MLLSELTHRIIEASIDDPKYGEGAKFIIGGGTVNGTKVANAIQQVNPNFKIDAPVTKQLTKSGPEVAIGSGRQLEVTLKDENGATITIVGSGSVIRSGFNNYKGEATGVGNKGEIAEGVLGAAMVAKFAKRTPDGIGTITVSDINEVLNSLSKSGVDEYTATLPGKEGANKDTLVFVLKLKTVPYKDLMDPNKRNLIADLFSSAEGYANSKMASKYAGYFYKNFQNDLIKVISDGISDESGRKTDVYVEVESPIGSKSRLTKLDVSLKAGPVKQFGQVGGAGFDKLEGLFRTFGVDISSLQTRFNEIQDKTEALQLVYSEAANALTKRMTGDEREEAFIKEVVKGINYFGTLNDPNIKLVQFDKGAYSVIDFSKLESMIDKIDMVATVVLDKNGKPQIRIADSQTGERFLTIRSKIENKTGKDGNPYQYIRNVIEKEPLLSKMAKVKTD